MAATTPQSGAITTPMPATTRTNVSVTSINCDGDGQYPFGSTATSLVNGIRIAVPTMDEQSDTESDTELSNIDFNHQVNLRTKPVNRANSEQAPRPMSWEGGLSDDDHMDTVEKTEQIMLSDDMKPDVTKDYKDMTNSDMSNDTVVSNDRKMSLSDVKYETHDTSGMNGNRENVIYNGGVEHQPMRSLHKGPGIIPDLLGSPLLARQHKQSLLPANPSPDSAIHSVYTHSSPSQSPLTARHTAPYTPSLSRNNSDASHSSCYSYSSEFSPAHSPIQGRHMAPALHAGSPLHHSVLVRGSSLGSGGTTPTPSGGGVGPGDTDPNTAAMLSPRCDVTLLGVGAGSGGTEGDNMTGAAGISRQQLINSPCPICGDKISGFHYGIFSCESCKGFFKRTVQNRKNYVCLRGAGCPVSIATRKKCPACRFDKCLQRGMKLEAIREDRTRGGRSTYQCSYTLPAGNMLCPGSPLGGGGSNTDAPRTAPSPLSSSSGSGGYHGNKTGTLKSEPGVPALLQEIMDVEHLWQYNESELNKFTRSSQNLHQSAQHSSSGSTSQSAASVSLASNPLLARAGITTAGDDTNPDFLANLCNIADHRLYKIVKWCKSLPLFKNISIDDQICLLINSWCELLLFSCCYRSMGSPGEIRVSLGKSISLDQARHSGLQACIERMLNLTEHLRRLRVDRYEYVAMKVIVLLTSDTSELREPEKVRASQEKALQALQAYTLSHYPHSPAKFGELLLRIPELQRTCQVGKEMLTIKSKDGEGPSFNLLMELLRGEH